MLTVLRRELRLLLRDPYRMLIVMIVPLFYMAFYGTVFYTSGVERIAVGVLNQDGGALSRKLVNMLHGDPVLEVNAYTDADALRADLERRRITAGVVIPSGWEATLKTREQARLRIDINTVNFLLANEATKHLQTVCETMNAGLGITSLQAAGIPRTAALKRVQPIVAPLISAGNPSYGYGQFVTFGILIIIIHQLLLISLAQSVAAEREFGATGEWARAARGRLPVMLAGKAAPYVALFVVYFFFEMAVALRAFHLKQLGSLAAMMLYGLPMLLTLSGMALVFGSQLRSRAQALQVLGITSVPFLLICGFLWPWQQLPLFFKALSLVLPTYPLAIGAQSVTQLGSSFGEQLPWFLIGCGQAVVWLGVAFWRWRVVLRSMANDATNRP